MPLEITPILEEPALIARNTETALVIADIHLGIEWDLCRSGIHLPSRIKARLDRVLGYIQTCSPDRIVLLGDVKHNVPQISWQEKDEIPHFLETLAEHAHVEIFPGNHDGGIEYLFSRQKDIRVHPVRGEVIDGVGYFHGHTWPAPELLATPHVITAHNHPTVRFTDTFGYSIVEPVWIRTRFNVETLKTRFGNLDFENKSDWADPEIFIMPAFNELCGGVPFNESTQEDLLGPVFSSGGIELENAEVYLLDGTRLGLLRNIRKLQHTRARSKTRGWKRNSKSQL
ncbi:MULTISPECIES: metallophosphoesterase [unclassified Methanosarcina]|uniref:metallophosphoesterase n=1 Tax=unclassified Methanosarcina TaxID=2644672 RepID=UPI000615BA12|nr:MULTISPECIES: metallophosphoesterase [unclassified Methanosarcina]AKB17753.1 Phosphoesterase [Methanosarcina sp. WWM596]AKB21103.1 Phosphoesterase [Methanosarcina sp. WH1]